MQDRLNYLLTNHIPRATFTRWMGRFSKIQNPWLAKLTIGIWQRFSDLDLSEAHTTEFDSLHACFTRALKPGARVVDQRPSVFAAPCDGIVGAHGRIENGTVLQAKGMPYALADLLGSAKAAAALNGGTYLTLRLTATMYHRFHAPTDLTVKAVRYIAGEVFNVNPPTVARMGRLFCKNERAVLQCVTAQGHAYTLVPVAAVLVASIRLHGITDHFHIDYKGPTELECNLAHTKGQEMGWFEHGSTVIVLLPKGACWVEPLTIGQKVKMGQGLMYFPGTTDERSHN